MRNFQLIAVGVDTMPMLLALHRHPELWNSDTFRTTYQGTPHSEADDILLRYTGKLSKTDNLYPNPAVTVLPGTTFNWVVQGY